MDSLKQVGFICKLLRIGNLLIIAGVQLILYYFYILPFLLDHGHQPSVEAWQVILFVTTTVLIAAGGNILNDIVDQDADAINKPEQVVIGKSVTEKSAIFIFFQIITIGALSSVILAYSEHRWDWWWIYPVAVGLLILYNKLLKCIPVAGNLLISLFCAGVFGIVVLLEWNAILSLWHFPGPSLFIKSLFPAIMFCWLAFWVTWGREMIKDVEDSYGDNEVDCRTLSVILGIGQSKIIIHLLLLVPALSMIYAMLALPIISLIWQASLILLTIPIIYVLWLAQRADETEDFSRLSQYLKSYMLLAILVLLINM